MDFVVMGAGAVGGYFGARLAQAGHDVTFVARGDHLRELQASGLQLRSALGDLHLPSVRAVADPGPIGDADVVLFTVKAQQSESVARKLLPLVGEHSRVLTLQNGVDGVALLERMFGPERVWGGVAYLEAVVSAPGRITHTSPFARIVFGPLTGSDARAEQALVTFRDAGIETTLAADPLEAVWRKWVLICAFSGLTALTRKPIGDVLAQPETRELFRG
ncbi:MAG: 2-dehydropantoate 2-reductase, partial [Deinococcales bacterium]